MHWVYYFGRVLIRIIVFPFANWRVKGRENVPADGPLLIACNHLHIADPPIIATSIKLRTVLMAKEDLWQQRWSRFWVENFGAFPVRRESIDRESIRTAEDWLHRGVSVIIFPEGGRSKQAVLQPALPGAALIAAHMGVPVLPVGITGTDKLRKLGWCLFHRPRITVNIGRPFNLTETEGRLTRDKRRQLADEIMKKIAELLPPEYHGVYGGNEDDDDREGQ
jgi:1-acyl-sn-glycerol-3-phosphate acyltransferase